MRELVLDLTGGLDPVHEYGLRDHPNMADMREGVSAWIYDDRGRFGFPRIALEAVGPDWDPKRLQVNVAFPDGRVYVGSGRGPARPSEDAAGLLSIFAGGPLEFRCLEPFHRWSVSFDGTALETTSEATAAGSIDDSPRVPLRFSMEISMAVPPWVTGDYLLETAEEAQDFARFIGGRRSTEHGIRYEQLCRAEGTLEVAGEEWSFTGPGSRIHRQGLRNLGGFAGHVWQSAVFPSGRGFAWMWNLRSGGDYKEGFLFEGDRMIPARIVQAPWLTQFVPSGEDASVVFESELGRTTIEGRTVYSLFIPVGQEFPTEGTWPLDWQQAGVRFRWDGEETYGMMERSSPPEKVTR